MNAQRRGEPAPIVARIDYIGLSRGLALEAKSTVREAGATAQMSELGQVAFGREFLTWRKSRNWAARRGWLQSPEADIR